MTLKTKVKNLEKNVCIKKMIKLKRQFKMRKAKDASVSEFI